MSRCHLAQRERHRPQRQNDRGAWRAIAPCGGTMWKCRSASRCSPPETAWPRVKQRLREAFATERRLPDADHPRGLASAWPASPAYEFRDLVNWPDARERVWQSWARAKGVYPYEVSRMEEALGWLMLV